jgi:hypothetical protein
VTYLAPFGKCAASAVKFPSDAFSVSI